MDPNRCLESLVAVFETLDGMEAPDMLGDLVAEANEHFTNLNEWLENGGALPDAWAQRPRPVTLTFRPYNDSGDPTCEPVDVTVGPDSPGNLVLDDLDVNGDVEGIDVELV